jgi:poly-gamma-glutamate system protein
MKRVPGRGRLYLLGALGLLLFALFKLVPPGNPPDKDAMLRAAEFMASAERTVRECREAKGMALDRASDINLTGLIGIQTSPVTTTLGNLEAKRTTTNPNFAGLLVRLLVDAGVRRGDAVAVGASGSFPALVVAVLAAAQALDAEPLLVCSLGASQWGANDPRFDELDMFECLERVPGARGRILALAVGGDEDRGGELSVQGRKLLEDRIRQAGLPAVEEPNLERNVERRVILYLEGAAGRRIGAFVNVGGSWANIGTDASVLRVAPGLARVAEIPPAGNRGVLQEMASRGVPVIHLLNIKGLAAAYGLPWDPSPLPRPGEGDLYARPERLVGALAALCAFYVCLAVLILVPLRRGPKIRRTIRNSGARARQSTGP